MTDRGETTVRDLARAAAEAMAALGSCSEGTWRQRLALLQEEGERCDSGYDEVVEWFKGDE